MSEQKPDPKPKGKKHRQEPKTVPPAQQALDEHNSKLIASYDLDHLGMLPNEKILLVVSDHFMEWVPKVVPMAFLALVFIALIILQASGLIISPGPPPNSPFNFLSISLLVLLLAIGLLLAWQFWMTKHGSKGAQARLPVPLIVAAVVVGGLLLLSLQMTIRVRPPEVWAFSFEQLVNPFTALWLLLVAVCVGYGFYAYVESQNDHLILTNKRVILSDKQVFGQYNVQQVYIREIQSVSTDTRTYLEHWLKFGTIVVSSVRTRLTFPMAEEPQKAQEQIDKVLKGFKNETIKSDLNEIVETQVYGKPKPKHVAEADVHKSSNPFLLSWLPENPLVEDNGNITWRPHWVFLIRALMIPVGLLALGVILVAILALVGFLQGIWIALVGLAVLLASAALIAYEIEDYVNDKYILTPTNVVDIEKKPWGPEARRSASLGALQNVEKNTTLIGRTLFQYGDVFLETAAVGRITFRHVPLPDEVVQTINAYQDEWRLGETRRNLENAGKLLGEYHQQEVLGHSKHIQTEDEQIARDLDHIEERIVKITDVQRQPERASIRLSRADIYERYLTIDRLQDDLHQLRQRVRDHHREADWLERRLGEENQNAAVEHLLQQAKTVREHIPRHHERITHFQEQLTTMRQHLHKQQADNEAAERSETVRQVTDEVRELLTQQPWLVNQGATQSQGATQNAPRVASVAAATAVANSTETPPLNRSTDTPHDAPTIADATTPLASTPHDAPTIADTTTPLASTPHDAPTEAIPAPTGTDNSVALDDPLLLGLLSRANSQTTSDYEQEQQAAIQRLLRSNTDATS